MKFPVTLKMLTQWGGNQVLKDAEALVTKGFVVEADYDPPYIRGAVMWNNRPLRTAARIRDDGGVDSECPCWTNRERGLICPHVVALGLVILRRSTDPLREEKYQAEMRRASRLAAIREDEYIRRAPEGSASGTPAALVLSLSDSWQDEFRHGAVSIFCQVRFQGQERPADQVPRTLPLSFSRQDDSLLFVLEDVAEGPAKGRQELRPPDFFNLLSLLGGKTLTTPSGKSVIVNQTKLITHVRMDLNAENGQLVLKAHTELPFMKPGETPFYLVAGKQGWVLGSDHLWPLENVLPQPCHAIYEAPVVVARDSVIRFLQQELPVLAQHARIESDITLDLFTIDPATPRFRLLIQGSPASLAATLYARYNALELVAAKPDPAGHFAIPDSGDVMRYFVRNPDAERRALDSLTAYGLRGDSGDALSHVVGNRDVLNLLASAVPSLRRRGWQIDFEGRIAPLFDEAEFAAPVVRIHDGSGEEWFDVGFQFEDGAGQSLSHADIQAAIERGDGYLKKGSRTILIDAEAVRSMFDIFSDCATSQGDQAGTFRMSGIYAPFVKSSLDALDGVDVEDSASWRRIAGQQNRTLTIEPVVLPSSLDAILRPYQKEGVQWLRFLETHGFCGLLADEMGLGKTLETLAWLQMERHETKARGKPALIICPTSIVENWAEETRRFVPAVQVMTLSGADRHDLWDRVPQVNLVVTSYALLRRDLERYLQHEFSVMILDEAQHIKNRSTQNALAAKQVRAVHRLVLTGTPIENGVADLWSIMDFLMPGYLGSPQSFRQNYEQPITRPGPEADAATSKLRRKLHPFMLRRLKRDVAKDLPPKIEKLAHCELSGDQKLVYKELLEASRRKISNLVAQQGFNRSRMEILTTLMRLRQVCCHLDLLKLHGLKPTYPSAKMDLFFELLDEAFDSGHRILVFSQFVSMLQILRAELEKRSVGFCYLDGSTRERMKIVHEFNSNRSIPLFLISLKAGGTGLNLTGADMVIHFDPWWNPAVEDQATDRAYRIGQKRTVYSVKLISRDTVEEKVVALQQRKKAVIAATIESDEQVMQAMTWDDIREILSL